MSQTRYEILGTIGVGASSRVDKARDTLIDRTVVLKTIGSGFGSPELQKEFLREAQILGRLSHPNIIAIYDLGVNDENAAYLVMEYVPGKTLESVLAEKGPVPLARAGVWAGDLASALGRAHKAGVIHGDVKPANIFVTEDGQIKLGDFGIARFATQVSGSARLVGTPAYLSPEQIKGETQDHRSDIFSIGIVLYQLVTGVRPFDGTSVAAVCAQIVAMQPPAPSHHNPEIPKEFDRIVMRCLAKDPADRYPTGEALAASLYPFARAKAQLPAPRFDFSWFRGPLRPWEAWVGGGVVAAALVAIPMVGAWQRAHQVPLTLAAHVQAASLPAKPAPAAALPVAETRSSASSLLHSPASDVYKPAAPSGHTESALPARQAFVASAAQPAAPAASSLRTSASAPERSPAPSNPASRATAKFQPAAPSASLGIQITSIIAVETLAIFADQQLVATSRLSITKPGEFLHLDRPLPAGPHEFRIALYRQDESLHLERQGLAELQPGSPNLLSVHVVRHAKILVKHDADLEVHWPASSPTSAPSKDGPERDAGKSTGPLVAGTSTPASR